MFSPATKKSNFSARKDRNSLGRGPPATPITPLAENRRSAHDHLISDRPSTGTPAPWASRLSVLARTSTVKKSENEDVVDPILPKYVGEFPQVVRDEQAAYLQKRVLGNAPISGGIDKDTSLSWIICRNKLFIWSYLSSAASRKCVTLDIPSSLSEKGDTLGKSCHGKNWLVCITNCDSSSGRINKFIQPCNSASVLLCNQKNRVLLYWPDIYSKVATAPVMTIAAAEESEVPISPVDSRSVANKMRHSIMGSSLTGPIFFNSLIASAIPGTCNSCIGLATSSNSELWQFICTPSGIECKKMNQDMLVISPEGRDCNRSKGYPRSLIWRLPHNSLKESRRQFLLLTNHEIQCFSIELSSGFSVSNIWSNEIIGTDGEFGIQKGLAGQKQIWPLDMQVDCHGKVITILIATFCKDRISSSSYTEYSLLTMQYKSGVNVSSDYVGTFNERVLEKKAPIQVIIPKARVEDEELLFSMRLKVGGKPSGSAIVLSVDGTATVAHYWRNSTRLYQFDLPHDGGKVLDASVFPSEDGEEGAWAILTEKAGVWAIPEQAVVLGGVEPPERSLSRKGSSNEGSAQEERRNSSLSVDIALRRASSDAWDAGDRQRSVFTGVVRRTAQDEESEALLSQIFHDFLLSGKVDSALDKLKNSGAFQRDGETNIFNRMSKSIVDTLAKHWTTTRGVEIVASTVLSTQLMDKQQKHQKFLQFLALSKCHEELCSRQRLSLQIIMEHGEKLAGMIQLREIQKAISQNRLTGVGSPDSSSAAAVSGSLWDLIQLVGDRARRNTVLLMDRDNAEVFYSKVSELEEVFYCLEKQLEFIFNVEMPFPGICDVSTACVTLLRTAMNYRNEHHLWYPPPEGLTPWHCQLKVRSGLWSLASFMLQLLNGTYVLDRSVRLDCYSHLEILTEVLLEAHYGAITAKIERGEDHRNLLSEYWNRRDTLLNSLYQQVKGFVQDKLQEMSEVSEENHEETLRKLSASLLSTARRHEGYQTMWDICCDLNDSELLRNLMHENVGPKGGFSYFVFKQLYDREQFSKLMRLGEELPNELASFLMQHQDLLWLHEVFLHQFSSASETLHMLALSKDDSSIAPIDLSISNLEPSLADRKRLLNLSKIAVVAGKDADYNRKLKRIEADLRILKLQNEILNLLPDNDEKRNIGRRLLPPVDLIELCLRNQIRELSLLAFEVFAWTSSSFLKCNTTLLEDCWRNAANQDDWERLYQRSIAEGWSDEENLQCLQGTILFQASNRCYGPEAETSEGSFEEVLPLRQGNVEVSSLTDSGSSVETILRQHKDYPDAGKLMLTAIVLGTVREDMQMEESPCPME